MFISQFLSWLFTIQSSDTEIQRRARLATILSAGLALTITLALPDRFAGGNFSTFISNSLTLAIMALLSFLGAKTIDESLHTAMTAQRNAEMTAQQLININAELEQRIMTRTADLQTALTEVEARAQAQLLAENEQQRVTIRELSVPVIPIDATTLIMPLVGALDTGRLHILKEEALQAVERTSARTLIMDITGVLVVDSQVAQGLINVVQAARLLGVEAILAGIRPEVAQAIVAAGINLSELRTAMSLQSILSGTHQRTVAAP
ncbi:MAG TPA: STAS domain-containing protein [Herpetosiphonaceae bacterium]